MYVKHHENISRMCLMSVTVKSEFGGKVILVYSQTAELRWNSPQESFDVRTKPITYGVENRSVAQRRNRRSRSPDGPCDGGTHNLFLDTICHFHLPPTPPQTQPQLLLSCFFFCHSLFFSPSTINPPPRSARLSVWVHFLCHRLQDVLYKHEDSSRTERKQKKFRHKLQ